LPLTAKRRRRSWLRRIRFFPTDPEGEVEILRRFWNSRRRILQSCRDYWSMQTFLRSAMHGVSILLGDSMKASSRNLADKPTVGDLIG
jgi:hypothetical protein